MIPRNLKTKLIKVMFLSKKKYIYVYSSLAGQIYMLEGHICMLAGHSFFFRRPHSILIKNMLAGRRFKLRELQFADS